MGARAALLVVAIAAPGSVSPASMCSDSSVWYADTDINDGGAKLAQMDAASAAECCANCAANPLCFVWNYKAKCKLRPKASSLNKTTRGGCTSGVRADTPTPPSPAPPHAPTPLPAPTTPPAPPPRGQQITVTGPYTMVYDVARDACDPFRDDSNGPIAAFTDRQGVVNLMISNTFVSVRSTGGSILDTFGPGGGFVHNCSQNISTADQCPGHKGDGCSVGEFRGQHYPYATWAANDSDRVALYLRNNDGIGDPCCRIAPDWPGHDPPGCAGPHPPASGYQLPLHTPCPHVNTTDHRTGGARVGAGNPTEHDCCKYWSILQQVSDDGGRTWTLPPVPERVAFGSPFMFTYPQTSDVDDMSGIVHSPKDGFYYAFIANSFMQNNVRPDLAKAFQGDAPCRTPDPMDTAAWRCWDGSAFTIQYRNPYLYPAANPEKNLPHILPFKMNLNWFGNIVWSTSLELFILVASLKRYPLPSGEKGAGIVYITSPDFLHWSDPQTLLVWDNHDTAPGAVAGESDSPRAAIFESDPAIAGRNFDKVGDSPYLFYHCSAGKPVKHVGNGNICRVPLKITP